MITIMDVLNTFEEYENISSNYYENYVLYEFMDNCSNKEWVEINGSNVLSKHVIKHNFNGKTFTDKESVEDVYSVILNSMLNEFLSNYISHKANVIIMLYNIKKINSVMASFCLAKMFDGIHDVNIDSTILKQLSKILTVYEDTEEGYASKYKDIELFFAKEKIGVEILLEALIDTPLVEKTSSALTDSVLHDMVAYAHEIGILVTQKDFIISNIFKCNLVFDEFGMLEVEIQHQDLESLNRIKLSNMKWLETKEANKFIVPPPHLNSLSNIVKQRIGLSITELELLHNKISDERDTWRIATIDDFKTYIENYININNEQYLKIVDLWVRKSSEFDISIFKQTHRDSRVTRKPLVPLVGDYYLFSDNVLLESIALLKNHIYDPKFYQGKLKSRFDKISNRIDTSFEVAVKEKISEIKGIQVLHHLERIKGTSTNLQNEIDLIIVTDNSIYIGECKNFIFKSEFKAIRNELIKTKGEFTLKLNAKVNSIRENLQVLLLNEFGISDYKKYEDNVIGLFITNNFSFTSSYKGLEYESVNYSEVTDFFKKKMSNS